MTLARLRTLLAALAVALFAVAPAFAQDDIATDWTCPDGFAGQSLSVYNWTTYIAEDTIANFEALCDVDVTYDTFPTDDEMLARIRQGNPGYDIVVPSGSVTYLMIDEGLLLPLDRDNIPNYANLDPTFTGLTRTTPTRSRTSGARSGSATTPKPWARKSRPGASSGRTAGPPRGSRTFGP